MILDIVLQITDTVRGIDTDRIRYYNLDVCCEDDVIRRFFIAYCDELLMRNSIGRTLVPVSC